MSMGIAEDGFEAFEALVNKPSGRISIAFIENAADIIPGSQDWLPGMRQPWIDKGYLVDLIDLRDWISDRNAKDLYATLAEYDVIWVGGGHTYYLRWIMNASGADTVILSLVDSGKIYAGWSAGAVIAAPSIKHFDKMGDDPKDAPEQIFEGLHLMEEIIVPHVDNADFAAGASATAKALRSEGYKTIGLRDGEFFSTQVSDTSKPLV